MPDFAGEADFSIRFQPFQLYPDLPSGTSNDGVDKLAYFTALGERRYPGRSTDEKRQKIEGLVGAWARDGLALTSPFGVKGGRWGSSFDAQRLIWLARQQGKEDAMIERIYELNHVANRPLSDHAALREAARAAGVDRADELLADPAGLGAREVEKKTRSYVRMGITAVPVLILDEKYVISNGCPEHAFLRATFRELITTGTLPWGNGIQPATA